jgi:GNAT superfamily N-acetyltransferase
MTHEESFGLPRDLGDGLTLRWATPDDAEDVAQFNFTMHSEPPGEEKFLYHWTHDLMRGDHPTTKASDFTIVTDADGRIVSSLNLISQTWAYDGIPFPVGRPELVATLPEYRRRGLVREQMAVIHRKSAARGELVQAITGIPWYYRQYGYEMGLDLGGSRQLFWARPGNDEKVEQEFYRVRPATVDDIPLLQELYLAHLGRSLVTRLRSPEQWRYEMFGSHPESIWTLKPKMILTLDDEVVGYANYEPFGTAIGISELGVRPGHSWRAVGHFLVRYLREEAQALNPSRAADKQITNLTFNIGQAHAVYEALEPELEKQIRPYGWYVRVPDIPAFLRHIAPALERRLAGSVMAGHTGTSKINMYRSRFVMVWEDGRLKEVTDGYAYERLEHGDSNYPDLTFLQLLFGFRSYDELNAAFVDCYSRDATTRVLLRALFPKRPSHVIPLG